MQGMTIIEAFSLISSIASVTLALVAIWAAKSTEKEVRGNFQKTQEMMTQFEMRTKDVLAGVDKKSAVIERTVSESQQKLMDTLTNILTETVIPKTEDSNDILVGQMLGKLIDNPNGDGIKHLTDLMQVAGDLGVDIDKFNKLDK
jgi:hypothetical protein